MPGRRVGFMPQDISLSCDLKVGETLCFYGSLLGMTADNVRVKSRFLANLLELPPFDRFIDSLSGGQQRRVSLAITLIHDPELVILDEPTVGVDPIVRKRIWDHLFEMASCQNQTILITTHYIEEAAMANTVEMMYEGTIICEGPPGEVIRKHNCASLEEVFLKLCIQMERERMKREDPDGVLRFKFGAKSLTNEPEEGIGTGSDDTGDDAGVAMELLRGKDSDDAGTGTGTGAADDVAVVILRPLSFVDRMKMHFRPPTYNRVRAITLCNLRKAYRNVWHFVMHAFVPCLIFMAFQLTFGSFPKEITIGVVNDDTEELAAKLLSHVDANNVVLKYYKTYADGRRAVEVGDSWGLLHVQANFSDSLMHRFIYGSTVSNSTLKESSIMLAMDATCHPITVVVFDTINDAFLKFGSELVKGTCIEPAVVSSPLSFSYDIYERDTGGLMGFATPGIILCGIYFVSMANCILSLLSDKASGQFLRNIVAGITEMELLLGNMAAFSVAVFMQVVTYVILVYWVLGISCSGSMYTVFLLVLTHGLCGTAFGLFVSTFCSSEFTAIMLGFGTFLPSVCLSGVVWPIESIPAVLQGVCRFLPQTFVIESLRVIMKRGHSFLHPVVAFGFVSNVAWITAFLLASAILLRIK